MEVPTTTVSLQVDDRAVWCAIVTSVTTMLALAVANWLDHRRRQRVDEARHAAVSQMLDTECRLWCEAREEVLSHVSNLRRRVKSYQKHLSDAYARRGREPDAYLEERIESLTDSLVVARMEAIFKRMRLTLDGAASEADEFIADSDSEGEGTPGSPKHQIRNITVIAPNRNITVDMLRTTPTVLGLCQKVKQLLRIPLSRQLLETTDEEPEVLTLDFEAFLPPTLSEVTLRRLTPFNWTTGGKIVKTKSPGYAIIRTDQSVGLGEINVLTVRLNNGNNELHDLGAGAPRFTQEQGQERWIVSLYVEGGIASHDVPRLSSPGAIQTLLINGVTRKLMWFTTPYPTANPCSTMSLLKKDFPLTPLLQTHGIGAEFELID